MPTPKKLLIIDDDAVARKFLSLSTADAGLEIIEAEDGLKALNIVRNWKPDLILLDNMLPGELDGLQVCRRIREDTLAGSPYIVMVSSCGEKRDIDDGLLAGADEYIVKPVSPLAIKRILNSFKGSHCDRPSALAEQEPTTTQNAPPLVPSSVGFLFAIQNKIIADPYIYILSVLIPAILFGEYLIMWVLASTKFPNQIEALADSVMLSLFCIPLLHFFVILPMRTQADKVKKANEELRLTSTAFNASDAIMITDISARIIRVNHAFEAVTGYNEAEVKGHTPSILKSGLHSEDFYKQMWTKLLSTGSWRGEIWDRHKSGSIYPKETTIVAVKNELNHPTHYICSFKDISARKKTEEELYMLAYFDTLTGLPNREMLLGQLNIMQSVLKANANYGALLHIGIDKFSVLNDTLGHEAANQVLLEASRRIKYMISESTHLSRFGGSEFMLLITNIGNDKHIAQQNMLDLALELKEVLAVQYVLNESLVHKTSSIGCCLFLGGIDDSEELIKRADIALNRSKAQGGNNVVIFETEMLSSLQARIALEEDLRKAVARGELQLFYQLQQDHKHQCLGAEVLLRWAHPQHGIISPARFIPIAEESLIIMEIGKWVIDMTCSQIAEWSLNRKMNNLQLSVNVSAVQFKHPDFVDELRETIKKHSINPSKLKLELTESISIDDIEFAITRIQALRTSLGVSVSLDDFGTGYSSLSYLKKLPFDQIKIDQSFVKDVPHNSSDADMIKAIINMAHNFGFSVIAEGVETREQFEFLKDNGCLYYQGFLFGKPLPVREFERLLNDSPIELPLLGALNT
jgi:diguanylate cyclase (GGDEF)-like protein/PAS domain S-box-containing protein